MTILYLLFVFYGILVSP